MKNGANAYLYCVARCARGLICRHANGRGGRHRCALIGSTATPEAPGRSRRIWTEILAREHGNGHR